MTQETKKPLEERIGEIREVAQKKPTDISPGLEPLLEKLKGGHEMAKKAIEIIEDLIARHDRHYKTECEEEAFRLKCYREEIGKVEEENQLLKEQLEATEKMYQGALALLTAKEEKLEIATKALNSVINQNDGYSSVKIATRAVEKLLTEIGESDDK